MNNTDLLGIYETTFRNGLSAIEELALSLFVCMLLFFAFNKNFESGLVNVFPLVVLLDKTKIMLEQNKISCITFVIITKLSNKQAIENY